MDGLSGIKGAIAAAYPDTEFTHQVRNMQKYVSSRGRKACANNLKTINNAPLEQEELEALDGGENQASGKIHAQWNVDMATWT